MTSINTANINFKWDPKSLEIRTLAVERLLEPLVTQVKKKECVVVQIFHYTERNTWHNYDQIVVGMLTSF